MPGRPHRGDRAATLAERSTAYRARRCQGYWRSCADEGHRPVLGTLLDGFQEWRDKLLIPASQTALRRKRSRPCEWAPTMPCGSCLRK
jgi:hypothetical protein